jgi:hypothetical protein
MRTVVGITDRVVSGSPARGGEQESRRQGGCTFDKSDHVIAPGAGASTIRFSLRKWRRVRGPVSP